MLEREQTLESRSRLENLDEFMSVPKDYEENTPLEEQSLINFLTDLSLVADIDEADTQKWCNDDDYALCERFRVSNCFYYGYGRITIPSYSSLLNQMMIMKMEEERRICYVAITRAEELLYVTNATTRMLFDVHNPICLLDFKGNSRRVT